MMLQKKKRQIHSGSRGKIKHVESIRQRIRTVEWKGHGQRKEVGPREGQDPTTDVEGQLQRKELGKGQAGEKSARPMKWKGQGQKQERFHRWRIQQRLEKCTLRQSHSYRRARRCFEHFVAEAGMSCLYSCHQWHVVEEAVFFWASQSRGRLASCIHVKHRVTMERCPVGWNAQRQTPFQR